MISSAVSLRRAFGRPFCALAVVAVPAFFVVNGGASTLPKDPNAINCPSAPSGWDSAAVTKIVATPQSVPDSREGLDGELQAQGGNIVTVSCVYRESAAKNIYVTVSYALPTDPNPFSDFDLGCGTGAVNWDAANRVFRISSLEQWALASLIDSSSVLPASKVSAFEGVARKLLENVNGYAHPCGIVVKPTSVKGRIYFDILVAGANIKETFYTSTRTSGGLYTIEQIDPLVDAFHVQTKAGNRVLTVKLTRGIDYRKQTGHVTGRARFRVVVTASQIASCRKGANGILTVSTQPAVLLDVCGQTFLRGPAPRVDFYN